LEGIRPLQHTFYTGSRRFTPRRPISSMSLLPRKSLGKSLPTGLPVNPKRSSFERNCPSSPVQASLSGSFGPSGSHTSCILARCPNLQRPVLPPYQFLLILRVASKRKPPILSGGHLSSLTSGARVTLFPDWFDPSQEGCLHLQRRFNAVTAVSSPFPELYPSPQR